MVRDLRSVRPNGGLACAFVSTLATLFEALTAARRAGEDFDAAWEIASVGALGASWEAGDWAPVLEATRQTWEAAYQRLPASSSERALTLLGWEAELVDVGRACRRCGSGIPPERGRRGPASFCSDRCRRSWHQRARERVAA
jgi:hypothetical protein